MVSIILYFDSIHKLNRGFGRMNKKLMRQQASQIENFLQKEVQEETIEKAWKYVIDSVVDDKFRLLKSEAKKPVPRKITGKELAKFDCWKEKGSEVIETKKAFRTIGVRRNQVKEGKVFVRLGVKTFEITEFVRQEVKDHYRRLLEREFTPPEKKVERSA